MARWWRGANMKPMPASAMQRLTRAGVMSMATPSASSTSALPQRLVAERLPCLATVTPAPAAIRAAAVEMLKVWAPSPPVPQVSRMTSASTSTFSTRSVMARAMPTISSAVSPFTRSAESRAAVWASPTPPPMISSTTPRASSSRRSPPALSVAKAWERMSLGIVAVLSGAAGVERRAAGRVAGRAPAVPPRSSRKLAMRAAPDSVSTLSGWNCTPSTARLRWRSPMTSPASFQALRSSRGESSGSTISEW